MVIKISEYAYSLVNRIARKMDEDPDSMIEILIRLSSCELLTFDEIKNCAGYDYDPDELPF